MVLTAITSNKRLIACCYCTTSEKQSCKKLKCFFLEVKVEWTPVIQLSSLYLYAMLSAAATIVFRANSDDLIRNVFCVNWWVNLNLAMKLASRHLVSSLMSALSRRSRLERLGTEPELGRGAKSLNWFAIVFLGTTQNNRSRVFKLV